MPKFKNKKTGAVIEENLNFYVEKLRNNSNFEEIKVEDKNVPKNNKNNKETREEEVETTPQK